MLFPLVYDMEQKTTEINQNHQPLPKYNRPGQASIDAISSNTKDRP